MGRCVLIFFFFFQAEDGIRDVAVTGVQTCALPISSAVQVFFIGVNIIPFVSPWSTMDNIQSNPSSGGRSVIKSMEIWVKGFVEEGPLIGCIGGFIGSLFILYCCVILQPLTDIC